VFTDIGKSYEVYSSHKSQNCSFSAKSIFMFGSFKWTACWCSTSSLAKCMCFCNHCMLKLYCYWSCHLRGFPCLEIFPVRLLQTKVILCTHTSRKSMVKFHCCEVLHTETIVQKAVVRTYYSKTPTGCTFILKNV
jgi:hypothetical protein